ncbi:transcription initiation factor TFIID subunit 4B [Discoglossus pictus]
MHASQAVCAAPAVTASHALPGPAADSTATPAAITPPVQSPGSAAPLCALVTKVQAPKVVRGPRMTAPAPPKSGQTTIQLPANFQIPPGTVLIRSGNGQLMLVSQQALARAQAQVQTTSARPPVPTNSPTVQCTIQSANSASNGTRPSTPVSAPTVVRICAPPIVHSAATGTAQGASAVLIRASAPATAALNALSCTSASTSATTPAPLGVQTTKTVTVLPVRSSAPLVTPITVNACSSVIPTTNVNPSSASTTLTTTPPTVVRIHNSSGTTLKTHSPTAILTATTCSPAIKLTTANVCRTTTTTASPFITSSITHSSPVATSVLSGNNVPTITPAKVQVSTTAAAPTVTSSKIETLKVTHNAQPSNSTEVLDNVKKCKNFLATLIKLASSGQSPTMGQNVKNLVKSLLDSKIEPEEFTAKLYAELKSSPQPYLVPFLKKSLPALRQLMPNSQTFILQCGQQTPQTKVTMANSLSVVKITPTQSSQTIKQIGAATHGSLKIQQTPSAGSQTVNSSKVMNIKQLVVPQPTGGIVKHVAALQPSPALNIQKPGEKRISLNTLFQTGHLPPGSFLKQITLPGNKVISLQASPLPIKETGTACFREEDDINDVTSMAGVNLNEENACILATNSELVGTVIRSCKDEPFLFTAALHNRILDIGKRHDINELNSDVMDLVSHATQERLRGLIEKLTVAAQHRSTNCKNSDRYIRSSDVRAQLKFLEQLENLEKQRKNEEEREMLLRAAKSRSNKEDPEHLRLKQKAKEMQQMELEQIQYREANLTALAAIGPRKKRPLDSPSLQSGLEEPVSSAFGLSKPLLFPRITRVTLRDLIYCMEQERETRHSLSLYRALLK